MSRRPAVSLDGDLLQRSEVIEQGGHEKSHQKLGEEGKRVVRERLAQRRDARSMAQ